MQRSLPEPIFALGPLLSGPPGNKTSVARRGWLADDKPCFSETLQPAVCSRERAACGLGELQSRRGANFPEGCEIASKVRFGLPPTSLVNRCGTLFLSHALGLGRGRANQSFGKCFLFDRSHHRNRDARLS